MAIHIMDGAANWYIIKKRWLRHGSHVYAYSRLADDRVVCEWVASFAGRTDALEWVKRETMKSKAS